MGCLFCLPSCNDQNELSLKFKVFQVFLPSSHRQCQCKDPVIIRCFFSHQPKSKLKPAFICVQKKLRKFCKNILTINIILQLLTSPTIDLVSRVYQIFCTGSVSENSCGKPVYIFKKLQNKVTIKKSW